MLHHDEVHVYPIIDTRTNKLITAITDNSISSTSDPTLTLLLKSAVAHEYM